jgi:hypothetical protein
MYIIGNDSANCARTLESAFTFLQCIYMTLIIEMILTKNIFTRNYIFETGLYLTAAYFLFPQ